MKSVFLLDREIIFPPYTFRDTFFFHGDIIGVVLGPPVNDWLVLSSATHQTKEIPAYDKKSYAWHCWKLTDFQSSTPYGHLVHLNVQSEKQGIASCLLPLKPTSSLSSTGEYPEDVPLQSLATSSFMSSHTLSMTYTYCWWCTGHAF